MLLATALAPAYYRMLLSRRFTVQTNRQQAARKETITPSFLRFWVGERKLSMQPKFVAAQKMLLKQKPQQAFVNGLLGFITLGIYTPLEAQRITRKIMICPSIWAALSALLINILLGSFQLFLHSDQPLSEGDNPVQRCLPVRGRLHYPRRRRW